MKIKKITRLPLDQPITTSFIYTMMVDETEGFGCTSLDFNFALGVHANDMAGMANANPVEVESKLTKAILGRVYNVFPNLLAFIKMPSLEDFFSLIKKYYPNVQPADLAVLMGVTPQSVYRWYKLLADECPEKSIVIRAPTKRLMRVMKVLHDYYGKPGIDAYIALVVNEYKIRGEDVAFDFIDADIVEGALKSIKNGAIYSNVRVRDGSALAKESSAMVWAAIDDTSKNLISYLPQESLNDNQTIELLKHWSLSGYNIKFSNPDKLKKYIKSS